MRLIFTGRLLAHTHACTQRVRGLPLNVFSCASPLQSRSPKHGPSPQPGVGDQVDHLSLASLESLDTMSDVDTPTGFTRGTRVRASLPVVRSTNQTKDRSLGRMCRVCWRENLYWIRLFSLLLTSNYVSVCFSKITGLAEKFLYLLCQKLENYGSILNLKLTFWADGGENKLTLILCDNLILQLF